MELRIHFHIDPRSRNHHQVIMERIIRELDAAGIHYVMALEDPPHMGDSAPSGSSTTSSGPGSSIGLSAAGSPSGLPAGGELSNPGRSEPHSNHGNLSPRAQIPGVQTVRPSGPLGFPQNSNQGSIPFTAMSFQVKVDSRTGRPVPVAGKHIRKILIETGAVNPIVECISGAGRSGKSPLRPGSSQRRLFARGKKSRRPGRQKEASGAGSRQTRASATPALPLATSINANPGSGNAAASSSGCTTFTVRMNRVGVDPATGMPSEQFVERLRRGLEMAGLDMSPPGPSGEDSFDVGSSGAISSGASPSGRGSSSAGTSGRGYSGPGSHGAGPSGRGSSGRGSSGRDSFGAGSSRRGSSGAGPSSAGPSDASPPGAGTSGRVSSGAELSGQGSSGAGPSGAGPSGARANSGHATPYADAASSHSEEFESGVWDSDTSSASSWSVVSSEPIPSIGGSSSGGSDVAGLRGAGKSKPDSNPRKLSRRGKESRRPSRIAAKASQQSPASASASLPIETPATSALSDAEIASLFSLDLNEREHTSVRYENVHIDPVTGQPDAASVERIKKEGAKRGWDLENLRIGHDERPLYKNPEYLQTSHSNSGSSAAGPSGADSSSAGASAAGPSPRGSSPHPSSTAEPSDTGDSGGAGTSKLSRRGKQSRRPSRVAAKAARKNEPSTTASLSNQASATPAGSAAATANPSAGGLRDGEVVKLTFDGVDIDPETGQPSAAFKGYARKLAADHGSDIGYLKVGDRTVFKSVKDARLSDWNTGSSKAGPSGAGSSRASSSGAGSSGAGPSGAGSSRVRPSKVSISRPGFFGAGSSGAGPSGAGTFGAGVFGAGYSGAGTSGAGTSETGTSGAGASRASSSAADPANPDGSSGAGTSKASSPPRKLAPRGKQTRRPTRQGRPSRKELATATSATSAAPTAAAADSTPLQMQLEIQADPATGLPDPNAMAHIQSVLDEVGGSVRLIGHYDAAAELEYGTAHSGATSAGAGPSGLGGGPSSASYAHSSNSGSLRLAHPPGMRGASSAAVPRLTRPARGSRVATANAPPTPRTLQRRAKGSPPQSPPPSPASQAGSSRPVPSPPSPTGQASSSRPDSPPAPRRGTFTISGHAVDLATG
jgi:hypothetical protein